MDREPSQEIFEVDESMKKEGLRRWLRMGGQRLGTEILAERLI
jgi:hypothetical protein